MRLEKVFLEKEYFLSLEKFGMRRVDFFISTINGKPDEVAKVLFNLRQVIFIGKSIGQRAIGLRVQPIVKDSGQILDLMEKIKVIDPVRLTVWSGIVDTPENKMSVPSYIIDQL